MWYHNCKFCKNTVYGFCKHEFDHSKILNEKRIGSIILESKFDDNNNIIICEKLKNELGEIKFIKLIGDFENGYIFEEMTEEEYSKIKNY